MIDWKWIAFLWLVFTAAIAAVAWAISALPWTDPFVARDLLQSACWAAISVAVIQWG